MRKIFKIAFCDLERIVDTIMAVQTLGASVPYPSKIDVGQGRFSDPLDACLHEGLTDIQDSDTFLCGM